MTKCLLLGFFCWPALGFGAITAVTATATTAIDNGVDFTITSPAGVQAGDLLLIVIAEHGSSESIGTVSDTATGTRTFTQYRFGGQSSSNSTSIWYRVMQSGDPTGAGGWTVTDPGSSDGEAAMMAYRGVDNVTPIDANGSTNVTSGTTTGTFNAATTVTNNAWYVGGIALFTKNSNNLTFATGSPTPNIRTDTGNGLSGQKGEAVGIIDAQINTAGSSGAFTYTLSVNSWGTDSLALRPASSGGGSTHYNKFGSVKVASMKMN